MSAEHIGWVVAVAFGALALIQTFRLSLDRRLRARRLSRARRVAEQAERNAERLLRRAGYRIEAVQPVLDWVVHCDGEPQNVELRADLLVSRCGRRFVAEVKSGVVAPKLQTAATRRQLLEYSVAYEADGVLLIDMEAERIHEVVFELPASHASGTTRALATVRPMIWAGGIAVAVATWWLMAGGR